MSPRPVICQQGDGTGARELTLPRAGGQRPWEPTPLIPSRQTAVKRPRRLWSEEELPVGNVAGSLTPAHTRVGQS